LTELAQHLGRERLRVADTPAARLRRFLLQPAALGLALALAVIIGLGSWFHRQATASIEAERKERIATVEATGLAEGIARLAESAPDDAAALQSLIEAWAAAGGGERRARVLRLSGARLLASNERGDLGGELPRRLTREEKWLFDLGQELRAAADTNRDEGVFRKPQISLERPGYGRVIVALPLESPADGIWGLLRVDLPDVEGQPAAVDGRGIWLAGAALVALLLAIAAGLERAGVVAREPAPRRRWLMPLVALLILAAASWTLAARWSGGLHDAFFAANEQVVAERAELRSLLAGLGIGAEAGAQWDVDRFQRPRGLIAADGTVDPAAVEAAAAERIGPFDRSLGWNFALALALLGFFGLGYAGRLRRTLVEYRHAYLYVTPAMLGMLVLVFFPFAYGITLSFTGQTIFNVAQPITELWVGFANYVDILSDVNVASRSDAGWVINYQNFYWTLFVTICWTASNVAVGVTLGMILALVLNTPGLKGRAIYRVLLILPWAIPNYITALIWKALFHPQFGAINQGIQLFGGEPVSWMDGVFSAFMTGLITNGWLSFPFMMVVILGGLQSISQDMYEAATVEGATRWQQFWNITLPLLKPTLVPAVILSVVWTFNMFNVIYLVSGGEPAGANEILITKAYKIAFEEYRYAYAAAYSTVIFGILLMYGVLQTRLTRATEAVHK
jgi:arabinogalactan oligomer/maltooligosaccharide transport system permease protein